MTGACEASKAAGERRLRIAHEFRSMYKALDFLKDGFPTKRDPVRKGKQAGLHQRVDTASSPTVSLRFSWQLQTASVPSFRSSVPKHMFPSFCAPALQILMCL